MKKNIKIISLTSAALLALAPIAASTVNAADTSAPSTPAVAASNTNTQNTQTTAATNTNQSATKTDSSKTTAATADTSAINVEFTQNGKQESVSPDGLYFQISAGSSFDPTDFKGSNGTEYKMTTGKSSKISVDSNSVDSSKAGSTGTVKLTSTDSTGKTTTVSYSVFVKPEGLFQLNVPNGYVLGLTDTDTFYQGEKYYIGNNVKYARGRFYTGISKVSEAVANTISAQWIETKDLANSQSAKPDLVKKTIMHKAIAYTASGTKTRKVYSNYTQVYVKSDPIHIDGGKYWTSGDFYQIYNADGTETNYYVKVTNIDGTKRTLTKNAYIYSTSTRRTSFNGSWKLTKGSTVTTYGGSYRFKNGKRYYRIGGPAKQYVRTANF